VPTRANGHRSSAPTCAPHGISNGVGLYVIQSRRDRISTWTRFDKRAFHGGYSRRIEIIGDTNHFELR